ncbi:TetR/AcrR family transcriptional regulator [Guptibacillus algicola]|uniref:TetR/AcrR family transcriptional regulator n=1 Tax=Guptibacillus algicola TaxID=225844 RepID=UPI001CD20EFF|nr:TetR/AcrR family transcriptional regulator [Alkalihalobacillus algicola]MCA0988586.1 TetR/AcrR family transcriptional regulator [Alkalihalobacillus algicola]
MALPKSEEKRARILEAAIQMFSQNGYSKATIKDIANEAGVSFGTVFTYFENKDELFKAAVLEPLEEIKRVMLASPEPTEEPVAQLRELISAHFQFFAQQATYSRMIQYVIGQPDRFHELFIELDQFSLQLRDALRPLILKGQEVGDLIELHPDDVTDTYLAFINGVRLTRIDSYEERSRWDMYIRHALLLFGPKQ